MSIALISHPECLLHEMGDDHPECPARIQVIEQTIEHASINQFIKRFQATDATMAQIKAVHESEYVDKIFASSPQKETVRLDADTSMNPYTLKAALKAAGSVILAVDLVIKQEANSAFCNIRPPGHHAERARAMGFCIFNNLAVGVMHAILNHAIKRIAIIDFDVHHGNGTEDIFIDNQQVLFCSSFQYPFYPYSGADTRSKNILNVPMPGGISSNQFRQQVSQQWFTAIAEFQPELLFFSAGFDAHQHDMMANFNLLEKDYYWLTSSLVAITRQFKQPCPIISVLEGGYALNVLGDCVVAHLQGFI